LRGLAFRPDLRADETGRDRRLEDEHVQYRVQELMRRDARHRPVAVKALAIALRSTRYRAVAWREGSAGMLRSRFAAARVRPAHRDTWRAAPRLEEWLLIEWPPGKYNRRFLQMCLHHLVEPVACAPALGWEKGQVENQVGNLRDQLFRPKLRVKSLNETNAWLEDQCIAHAKRTQHPEFKDRTIWDVFQDERASLRELRGPFDGFVEKAVRASTTCLIMADHNRYSVDARCRSNGAGALPRRAYRRAAGRRGRRRPSASLPARPDHRRSLALSPGSGEEARRVAQRRPLQGLGPTARPGPGSRQAEDHADGDRQFVKVLGAVLDHGLAAVETACAEALEAGIASGDVILTVLARRLQPAQPPSITTPDALRLTIAPAADCSRYDSVSKVA
jgi:hypothetical protein